MQQKDDARKRVIDRLQVIAAELHRIFEPQWNARADVLKTIVSLSSGSIVLTVTFSASLRAGTASLVWQRLILVSFLLFVAALVCAFVGLRIGARVYEIQSTAYCKKQKIREILCDVTSPEEFLNEVDHIVDEILGSIAADDSRTNRLFRVSSICFCSAIILLAVVGARNLLI